MGRRHMLVALALLCDYVLTETRVCDDCQSVASCPGAAELANRMDDEAVRLLGAALCGLDESDLPKVCCGDFASEEERRLDRHPNLALLPDKCGKMDGKRIIGGTVAGLYEFPWMVLIGLDTRLGLRFACGGSLISDRYVLTAAHCVHGKRVAGVRVGEHNIDTDTDCVGVAPQRVCESVVQDRRVEKEIVHSAYDPTTAVNDIALLRLKRPVNMERKNAGAICLPTSVSLRARSLTNETAVVAGWGVTETHRASPELLKVNIPVYSKDECKLYYNRKSALVSDNNICAGGLGRDSCKGDSGGPLMLEAAHGTVRKFTQYGVVSFGPKQCGLTFPGVYTDVTKYMKWILDNIEE